MLQKQAKILFFHECHNSTRNYNPYDYSYIFQAFQFSLFHSFKILAKSEVLTISFEILPIILVCVPGYVRVTLSVSRGVCSCKNQVPGWVPSQAGHQHVCVCLCGSELAPLS